MNQETAAQSFTTDIQQPKYPPDTRYFNESSVPSAKLSEPKISQKHQCNLCEKSFENLLELDQHRAYEHLINLFVKSRPYKCSECSFTFVMKEHMINHRNVAHKGFESKPTNTLKLKPSTSTFKPKEPVQIVNPSAKKLKLNYEVFHCETCDFFCPNELFIKRHNCSKIHKSNELKKMENLLNKK